MHSTVYALLLSLVVFGIVSSQVYVKLGLTPGPKTAALLWWVAAVCAGYVGTGILVLLALATAAMVRRGVRRGFGDFLEWLVSGFRVPIFK